MDGSPADIRSFAFLIIVINNRTNVSSFPGEPPTTIVGRTDRLIEGGPLYDQGKVAALCEAGSLHLWSGGAVRDAPKRELDISDICELVRRAVSGGRYLRSEWCQQSSGGPWAACDAYVVDAVEWCEAVQKEFQVGWYLKFAVGRTGTMLLSISNHPEGA